MTTRPPALVDVLAFYERFVTVVGKSTRHYKEGLEWACDCPRCGGVDRASFFESGRFCCVRGCHFAVSSPYWFARDGLNYDHQQACEELNIDPFEFSGGQEKPKLPLFLTKEEAPNQKWQQAAEVFCHLAEKCLWGPKGETARAYLHSRGFTDATIRAAHLGLCPDWYKAPLAEWGLDPLQLGKEDDPRLLVPRGIVIPWRVQEKIWKIQLRRPEPGPDGNSYVEVLGSSDCLYNADEVQPGQPVLLLESELDARSAEQEAASLVACVATGSTTKGFTGRALALLLRASQVLVAFDSDEAGERGAKEWLRLLPKAFRWQPRAHDVNQMLQDGLSVRAWIQTGLTLVSLPEKPPANLLQLVGASPPALTPEPSFDQFGTFVPPALAAKIPEFASRPCRSCGTLDWFVDVGLLTCPCILQKREYGRQIEARRQAEAQKRRASLSW